VTDPWIHTISSLVPNYNELKDAMTVKPIIFGDIQGDYVQISQRVKVGLVDTPDWDSIFEDFPWSRFNECICWCNTELTPQHGYEQIEPTRWRFTDREHLDKFLTLLTLKWS
jgi:hypothetical protein